HRHRVEVLAHLGGREAQGAGAEEVRQVALRVDLAHEGPQPPPGGEESEGGGHRGLADATLAGDEQQLAVEQPGPPRCTCRGGRRHAQLENPIGRLSVSLPISTYAILSAGTATSRPRRSVTHSTFDVPASTSSTRFMRPARSTSSGSGTSSSRAEYVTPMRMSTGAAPGVLDHDRGLVDATCY